MPLPQPFSKFFADRGPHLAAMIAYFALLSFVPLLFLTVSLLGLAGRPDESSYLVTELKRAFPGSSVASIVHTVREIQKHATALGIVGGAALLWTSLSLFSVLESAFNIVYGKPNRSFLRGKLLAVGLMLLSLVTLFVGLLIGSFGYDLLKRYAGGFAARGARLPARGLLPADERRALVPRRAPGCCRGGRAVGGELPGAPALR